MALESQGVLIRRAGTAADAFKLEDSTALSFSTAANTINSDDTSITNFVESSFSSGMRIETNSSLLSSAIYTIKALTAATIELYETLSTSHDATSLTVTGKTMSNIGEIVSFTGPSPSLTVIDITNLSDSAKKKLVGVKDEGQVAIEVNYSASVTDLHPTLRTDMTTREKQTFDVVLTDSTIKPTAYYFEGYVVNHSITGSVDNALKGSITLEISSAVKVIPLTTTS